MRRPEAGGAVSRKVTAASWLTRVLSVVLVGGGVWYLVCMVIKYPWLPVALGGLGSLLVLLVRSPLAMKGFEVLKSGYRRLAMYLAALVVPAFMARWLSEVVAGSSPAVAVLVLLQWTGFFGLAVHRLSSETSRERAWASLRPMDRAAPFIYALVLAEVAVILFATLAFVMAEQKWIWFGTDRASPVTISGPVDSLDFFAWHILDSVPGLKVTETLKWDEPLTYDDGRVGLLLIAFKVVAIAPILGTMTAFWSYRRKAPEVSVKRPA